MALLLVVLTAITATFVSGTHAETNVQHRLQAQSDARLALTRMREDIHCALNVQSFAANAYGGYTLSLTEEYNQCAVVDSLAGGGSSIVYLAWCTIPDPAVAGTFDLYRKNGSCDSSGTLEAKGIVIPVSGIWPAGQTGNIWPAAGACQTGYLKTQPVDMAVNPDAVGSPNESYELKDEIALRNSTRSVGCTGVGPVAQLVFTTQPSGAVRNAPFATQPVVTAEDASGNTVTTYSATVTLSIKSGTGTSGAVLSGCSGTLSSGVVVFSGCKIDQTGTGYVLTATDGTFVIDSASFDVSGSVTSLLVAGYPSPTVGGVGHSFTVTAKDAGGTTVSGYVGTVHFTSNDGAATVPLDYTFTAFDNGTHTFTATLRTFGTRSITATDTVTGSVTGTQGGIVVGAGGVASFVVAGYTSPTVGNVSHTFTVTAKDAGGNTVTGYNGTVQFTSSDGTATLPGNYTFLAGDNGAHTFSATLKTFGTQSITATDTVTGSVTGSQTGIVVSYGPAATLVVAGYPSPTTAGAAHPFTVTAKDVGGNTVAGYVGTVHFTSTDGAAVLPADYTFVGADNGTHTFSATLKTSGTQSITATDTVTGSITGAQAGITVSVGPAVSFLVAGYPSPTVGNVGHTFTVTANDAGGNTVTGYVGTVHFTSSDGAAALPVNYTFVGADNGTHTFSATLKTLGTQSITATDTVSGTITGSQTAISVSFGSAVNFVVAGYPSPTGAGTSHTFTVTAKDAGGNTAAGYVGTVHFTSSDGAATLPVNYTFVAGDNGAHTFSATLRNLGVQSITATDTVTGSINGAQTGITVTAGPAATLVVAGYPTPTIAGVSHTFVVTATDAGGNTATGYLGTVTFSSSDAQAGLPANYTFVAGDNGSHTFTAILKTAGTRSITATDTVTGSITGTQSAITVNAAAATQMVFINCSLPSAANTGCTGQPIAMGNGGNMTFAIQIQDPYGNPSAAASAMTITFTNNDATFTITAGAPASITPPATTSGSVTLHHATNGGTDTLKAHSSLALFPDVTLTAKK